MNSNDLIGLEDFGVLRGFSRQYAHRMAREGRISPQPIRIGKVFLVSKRAKILEKTVDKRKR